MSKSQGKIRGLIADDQEIIRMPVLNGIQATRKISAEGRVTRLVIHRVPVLPKLVPLT